MSVIIYTYRDPYKLKENKELWMEISSCPYFCAAQTLVNGLKEVYGVAFQIGRVTTVKNLIDVLYEKWNGTACAVKQHADIDNIIVNSSDITGISGIELDNVKKSFLFNRDEVFTSIRTMFELKMEPQNIVDKYLTPEQRFIVSVYKKIRASEKVKDFCLEQDFTEEQINQAITKAMTTAKDNSSSKNEIEVETLDHIVIHGVHQFSPLLLRAIEEIAKYKKVILLINYQEQYKNIYQTWIDIYSAFDCEIQNFDGIEYYPVDVSAVSYDGNLLAHNIGKLIGGHKEDISVRKPYEIIEFDNMTEFASYVAKVFEDAEKKDPEHPMNALIYGLEFNRGNYKLSFVKRDGDQEREPYYLLKILGVKKERNIDKRISHKMDLLSDIQIKNGISGKYQKFDYYRFKICKKRFLLESLVEGNTIYKDNFLLAKYLEVWIENETKESLQGLPHSEILLLDKLNELYDELKKYFPFTVNVNRIDIINNVKNRLNNGKAFPVLSEDDRKFMMIRELFIYKQLKDPRKFKQDVLKDMFPDVNQQKIEEELSAEKLKKLGFGGSTNLWCKYCTNREICVDYYVCIE